MSGWVEKGTGSTNPEEPGKAEPPDGDATLSSEKGPTPHSSKFPLRKIGDLFRSKLRSSGSYSIRTLNDSVAQECKIAESSISDVEKVSTPVKNPDRVAPVPADVGAAVVNEKPTRNSAGSGAVRSRKIATLNRTFQRKKSANAAGVISGEDSPPKPAGAVSDSAGNGQKRQSISSQETSSGIESDVVVGKAHGRDRVNSASHYSTEKSGSSGYYSTNIYFAGGSVVDDHIYYEPVDRGRKRSTEGGSKTATGTTGKKEGILKNSSNGEDGKRFQKNGKALEKYYFPATLENVSSDVTIMRAKPLSNDKLPETVDGPDGPIPRPIWPLDVDDSLADINFEAFRMRNSSQQNLIGLESPASSISDNEVYSKNNGDDNVKKKSQYEEYLEFHNTRNILEQIRGKLNTLLEQRNDNQKNNAGNKHGFTAPTDAEIELEEKIANLKSDLEGYLQSMNQKNENEIKRFCKGMSKDAKVLAVQNAVEQRNRSRSSSFNLENDYEVLERTKPEKPPYYTVIPQRNMKNYPKDDKPMDGQPSHFETVYVRDGFNVRQLNRPAPNPFAQEVRTAQMLQHQKQALQMMCCQQRYLSNDQLKACGNFGGCDRRTGKVSIEMPDTGCHSVRVVGAGDNGSVTAIPGEGGILVDSRNRRKSEMSNSNNLAKNGDVSDFTLQRVILMESLGKSGKLFGDKEKMLLEYHLNKPSYWELYYGANREEQKPHHTLIRKVKIGGKNAISVSYPSTRPESDFTLDLPRAEQLRVKMKKEKQFRSRCRLFFYFLSVVFFLLSVMVVSLILTRGKRMFGSMI